MGSGTLHAVGAASWFPVGKTPRETRGWGLCLRLPGRSQPQAPRNARAASARSTPNIVENQKPEIFWEEFLQT